MSLDVQQNTMDFNNNIIHDKILRTTFTTTTCNSNTYQRRRLQRFRIRDHAKEFNVKLVKLTSFLLYLLHSLSKFDVYFHRKEFRRISRLNSLMNIGFFSFWVPFSNKKFAFTLKFKQYIWTSSNWTINHPLSGVIIFVLRLHSLYIKMINLVTNPSWISNSKKCTWC